MSRRSSAPPTPSGSRPTPLGSLVRGAVAGAVGTAAMDVVAYLRYRLDGGDQDPVAWEFDADAEGWDDVSTPGQVGRRITEGFLQRELPDDAARPVNSAVHWLYGIGWGAVYGLVAGSTTRKSRHGMLFGAVVWGSGYVVLPPARLYKPIWEYDAATLAKDLGGHLVYGTVTATVFGRILGGGRSE